jgi:putative Mg2+ transporter-C (MgtC) family protein
MMEIVHLVVAAGLGLAIGLERELHDKDAGLRTHATVALGAALFTIGLTEGLSGFGESPGTGGDFSRGVSQIVVGIGFLGAGTIFVKGNNVNGLTTAAGVWVTAAIGMVAGLGEIALAAAATALVLIVTGALYLPSRWIEEARKRRREGT